LTKIKSQDNAESNWLHGNASRAVTTRKLYSCIHILITTLYARSDVGNHTLLYSIFDELDTRNVRRKDPPTIERLCYDQWGEKESS